MEVAEFLFQPHMMAATLPPSLSFHGKSVLITGATSGLGLETAIHYVALGAQTVHITARNAERGAEAKTTIEARTGKQGVVRVHQLDMGTFAGVRSFVASLQANVQTPVDIVLLNAGVHSFSYKQSPDGWEMDLQVNVLSTALLGLLLLRWLGEINEGGGDTVRRLGFVNSGAHFGNVDVTAPEFPEVAVLQHWNKKQNYTDPRKQYGASKLFCEYVMLEIAKLATARDGRPDPIVNSVCPGLVFTDVARELTSKSIIHRSVVNLLLWFKGLAPEEGAKSLVLLGTMTEKDHAKFTRAYMSDEEYAKVAVQNITGEKGQIIQAVVWEEIMGILKNEL